MKKRMLAALLAGSMLLTACGGTGGQTASQAPKGEAPQSASADAGTQSGQKVTMKVSVGVADNHFEAVAVNIHRRADRRKLYSGDIHRSPDWK